MRIKRFLSCLLAVVLLLSAAPAGITACAEEASWSAVYESFVMNREFLSSAFKFLRLPSEDELCVSLYDLNGDGVPELLCEGGPTGASIQGHVFNCVDGKIHYAGTIGLKPYYYKRSAYRGLFSNQGDENAFVTLYYEMGEDYVVDSQVRKVVVRGGRPLSTLANFGRDRDLYAWSVAGDPTPLDYHFVSEIRLRGWEWFVSTMLSDEDDLPGTPVALTEELQHRTNLFLSNFSEQRAFERRSFDVQSWKLSDLVNFAYLYSKINRRSFLDVAHNDDGYFYTLSLDNANSIWSRLFGLRVGKDQLSPLLSGPDADVQYIDGSFYFIAADGERFNYFTVVRQMEDLGNGKSRLLFDIYELDPTRYWSIRDADFDCYTLTASAAAQDERLIYKVSGVAVVKPYDDYGIDTYQLVSYRIGEEDNSVLPPPVLLNSEERTVKHEEYSALFGPAELAFDALRGANNRDLMYLCAMLCENSYGEGGKRLKDVYRQMFGETGWYQKFDYQNNTFCSGIALGQMTMDNTDVNVLVVTVKGTELNWGMEEAKADFDDSTTDLWGTGYQAFRSIVDFEDLVFGRLSEFLKEHEEIYHAPLKIIITGHSLGGATANLLAAHLTRLAREDPKWAAVTAQDDIYAYTFGAIDCLDIEGEIPFADTVTYPISSGYENIHNIYNYVDSFGPNQNRMFLNSRLFSGYGKFGHIDLFSRNRLLTSTDPFVNHAMSSYLKSLNSVGEQKYAYSKVWVRCPVDVEIYQNDALVGSVRDDAVEVRSEDIAVVADEGIKMIVLPNDRGYALRLTASDDGVMEYSVEAFTDGAIGIKTFSNVNLSKGKSFSSDIGIDEEAAAVRLFVLENGVPVGEVMEDGTEQAVQTAGLLSGWLRWIVLALAVLLAALVCAVLVIAARRKRASRRGSKAGSAAAAFSQKRCCVCGRRLKGEYRVFFRTAEGEEARVDERCCQRLQTLMEGTNLNQIRDARRYVCSRLDKVDPQTAESLQAVVETADERLRGY